MKATDDPAATQGQVWKEYDLRTYLRRVRGLDNPQGAIIDWILRETGTSQWFGEVPGMLAVEADILRVYHVPAIQEKVAEIIDRFVDPNLTNMTVSVRLITVESTNWRALAIPVMTPVKVQTPGIEAWLIRKEDAALLSANLRQRVDYREHSSGRLQIAHGQSHTVERWIPKVYAQSIQQTPGQYPGYQINQGQLQEGYTLTISPLAHTDQQLMDVVVKCGADQVERTSTFTTDVLDINGQTTRVPLEVPQVSSWRVHERFRWPTDQLLIVSRGVVAVPGARQSSFSPIPGMFPTGPARADAILIFECRQATSSSASEESPESRVSRLNYHGRY